MEIGQRVRGQAGALSNTLEGQRVKVYYPRLRVTAIAKVYCKLEIPLSVVAETDRSGSVIFLLAGGFCAFYRYTENKTHWT